MFLGFIVSVVGKNLSDYCRESPVIKTLCGVLKEMGSWIEQLPPKQQPARLGLLNEDDYQALLARVFVKYLDLMRKLQTIYWLEPAGHMECVDDHHCLPFISGSAQLVHHKYMKPKSIHNADILENFSHEYLYLGCVRFVKKGRRVYWQNTLQC